MTHKLSTFFSRSAFLAAVSLFSIIAVSAQQSFKISTLTANNAVVISHEPTTGDDRGGIALSSDHLLYSGDMATGRFALPGLIGSNIGKMDRYDAMVSNIRTKQVYVLADEFGQLGSGGGWITSLIEVDAATGNLGANRVNLSQPVNITSGSDQAGIFSGFDRIVLLDGVTLIAYSVELPSGNVTNLGETTLDSNNTNQRYPCENWATWGVAENTASGISLAYAAIPDYGGIPIAAGYVSSYINRYDVTTSVISPIAEFPTGLSDMCSFTVDPAANKWYFHYESWLSTFGSAGTDENIGYADATFLAPSSANASISGRVSTPKGVGISGAIITATDSSGQTKNASSNTFGNFTISQLEAGRSYVVTIHSRRYVFAEPSVSVTLNDDISGLTFTAQ